MEEENNSRKKHIISNENPFGEEFDKSDVINKEEIANKKNELKKKLDVDSIINYSDELRKKKQFTSEFDATDADEEQNPDIIEERRLIEDFEDFLILPKISGARKGLSHSSHVSSEAIIKNSDLIEISNEAPYEDLDNMNSTILINKKENGEIDYIEVVCKCGERTIIKLDYE